MKLKDLRVSWRQLLAEPAYSLVVVLGLAVAIAAAYLIALLLNDRWLPDPSVPRPDRVVRLEFKGNIPGRNDDWFSSMPYVFRSALRDAKAPLSHVARVTESNLGLRVGEQISKNRIMFADPELVDIFGLKALSGDVKAALSKPDTVALTTSAAERLFGRSSDVLGQRLRMRGQEMTVAALLPRQAANSELEFDVLASFESPAANQAPWMLSAWYYINGNVYARLADGAGAAQLGTLMQSIFDRSPGTTEVPPEWRAGGRKTAFVRAVPLTRIPFEGSGSQTRLMLYSALSLMALTMLALAAINYVNLSSVRTLRRQREIAVRKSLGASPARLGLQFVLESSLVALLAGGVGLLLAWLLAPGFADLLDVKFATKLFAPAQLISLALACLLLGALTGLYPARVALGVHCAPALQGRKQSEGAAGRRLRRAMTVLQFGAALTLSGAAVVVVWQSEFVARINPGFKTEGLLAIDLPETAKREAKRGLFDVLQAQAAVKQLGMSDDIPGRNGIGSVTTMVRGETKVSTRNSAGDAGFFRSYEIPFLAGSLEGVQIPEQPPRGPEAAKEVWPAVIDATAAQSLGYASPQEALGQIIRSDELQVRVVAVAGAIRQESARQLQQPQLFMLHQNGHSVLTLNGPDMAALRAAVSEAWPRYFPDDVLVMNSVNEELAQRYRLDRNIGRLIAATSLLALLLAAFGVYALAAYTVRRAALEIVIRKLHGAGHRHIAALLIKEFAPLLGLAALISLPLIWWIAQQYLSGFVERAQMGGWPMLAATLVTLLMSGLAGLRHALAAMSMRPILALRD
ncbi:FtsX-like permease family protein [Paucibacter sp. DJ2R-2]|uniref:FtsX-like permease family protein n=1 Tax=Paucibacter sp. DJ2R-2 TaxID=2893558 RepID=UPI0021E50738|nr:FtsX-like permease family protein [Paucibacter sp. DJ2R-2]MCV2422004.1 ABC transporter permease [Paucibacter sp. DJ4R-1]MCV2439379.1 ABC transporter permease [Paucibacter sp. DJ2R-2]